MIEYYDVEYVGRVRVGTKLQLDGDRVINDWGEVTALLPGRRIHVYWHREKITVENEVDEVGSDIFREDWSEESTPSCAARRIWRMVVAERRNIHAEITETILEQLRQAYGRG